MQARTHQLPGLRDALIISALFSTVPEFTVGRAGQAALGLRGAARDILCSQHP